MLNALIYIFISFLILRGITQNFSRYVLIYPYILYASFVILNIIPDYGGMSEYSHFDTSIPGKAFHIQSIFVLSYLILTYAFSTKKNNITNQDKLISKINKLGNLVEWEKIINIICFISIFFLLYYIPRHLSSISSLNYNIDGTEIRDIPYISFLLNLNNAIYILNFCVKGNKINKLTLLNMSIPCFILSTLGIRLFLFKFLLLIFLTNLTYFSWLGKKIFLFPIVGKLNSKIILQFLGYLVTAFFSVFYLVDVFVKRVGEEWNNTFVRVIFQETVYNNIGFFRAVKYGGTENIDNFIRCSLLTMNKNGCEIHGALGISSLWAEIFSYKEVFILLISLVFFSFFIYIALTFCLKKYPWLFIILFSSIISGVFDIWRSSLMIGLSVMIKSFLALTIILIILISIKSALRKNILITKKTSLFNSKY